MKNEEAVRHLTYDWYQSLGGQVCIDADKADAFFEAVGIGIKAINGQKNSPAHIDREAWMAEWRELHGDKMVGLDDCGDDVYRHYHYSVCTSCGNGSAVKTNFCPVCGKAMTPEARAMLEKRLRG